MQRIKLVWFHKALKTSLEMTKHPPSRNRRTAAAADIQKAVKLDHKFVLTLI